MKKIVVITLVIALLAMAVTPAFAQGGNGGKGKNNGGGGDQNQYNYSNEGDVFFTVAGTITEVAIAADADPLNTGTAIGTITLTVLAGSHLTHDVLNQMDPLLQVLTITITDSTQIVKAANDGTADCTSNFILATELVAGLNVTVKGSVVDFNLDGVLDATDTWTADHVTVGAALTGTPNNDDAPRNQNHTGRP